MRITESKEFDIRYTTPADMPILREWLKTDNMLHWYPPCDDLEIENFIRIWIGFSRYNASITAMYKNDPVGMGILYLMPYRKVAHHAMFQIIVSPEYQKKGVGYSLVRNLKHLAKQFRLEFIHAEILDESPIISLLKTLGFTEFGRQEGYVKEEDCYYPRILMESDLL